MDLNLISQDSLSNFYYMRSQLKDHIYGRAQKYFDAAKKERSEIYTKEQLEEYNKAKRAKFIEGIGGIAWDRAPLDAKVTSVKEYEHYKMENIIFCSRRDTYVTGTMYIPYGLTAPSAAVLFVSGHSQNARFDHTYQSVADTMARAGLIVFAIDPVGQGERFSYYDNETGEFLIQPCTPDHDQSGIPATATGRFLQSYFLSDEMRAVDYMLTRPEIDPKRIGVTGNSGGGTQTMAMMAADDRIAAAAPATFVTSREAYMYSNQAQDSEQIWPGITSNGYDHINPIINFAPKPLALLQVNFDFFCPEGTVETYNEARRFYAMYGNEENICLIKDDSMHEYSKSLQRAVAKFFAKHLLGKDVDIDNSNFEPKPDRDYYNTSSGRVRGEIDGARFIYQENNELADKLLEERESIPNAERMLIAENWLRSRVYQYRTPYDFYLRKLGRFDSEKYITLPIFWHSQKDLFNFAFMIRAKENDGKKLPIVIAVWQNGTKAIEAHEAWIKEKCDAGFEVMVLDVSGMGYIEIDKTDARDVYERYAAFFKLDCDLIYMNDSLTALRSYDVLRAVEMLKSEYDMNERDITLYCESRYGVYGVIAAFLNKNVNVIYGEGLLESVQESYIKTWLWDSYNDDLSIILPGMLKYFDYKEIMR